MDTTDEEITFDENGVCNHCRKFFNEVKPKWNPSEKTIEELDTLIERIQSDGEKNDYDCVIGLSGGVDSSYLAYYLRKRYPSLRILAIHIDAGWNSELAVQNIENIVKKLDIDLYTGVINWEEVKDLQRAYFKSSIANQDVPQDHVFFSTLYDIAIKNNIKYFLNGGNFATESILPSSWGYSSKDGLQLKAIHKRFGEKKLSTYKVLSFFDKYIYYPHIKKLKIIRPLNYIHYNKDEAKEVLKDEIEWRDYGGKHHESQFTKFFQAHYLPYKFGFDKRKAHFSSLIVSGQMSRDDALKELQKPLYNDRELEEDKEFVAKKLGFSMQEFNDILNAPTKTYKDYPSEKKLFNFVKKVKQIFTK